MNKQELEVKIRKEKGSNQVKPLKNAGFIPGVIYGKGKEATAITIKQTELVKLYKRSPFGRNTIVELKIDDGSKKTNLLVIAHQIDKASVSRELIHIDFLLINESEPVEIQVPIHLKGTAKGQKLGGIIIQNRNSTKIKCLPADIPENIQVDISQVDVGGILRLKDLQVPDTINVVSDNSRVIMHIEAPRVDKSLLNTEEEAATAQESASTERE